MSALAPALVKSGRSDVTAIDFSKVCVDAMRERHKHVVGLKCMAEHLMACFVRGAFE